MMNDLEVAWDQVVEHLRAEADWRAGQEVEVLRSYRYAEPLGQEVAPGRSFYLEANLSHAFATLDESGMPVDFEFGDVFEHAETMVRLGDEAMGQIERELQQQASIGDDKALPLPLGHATEGGSEVSLQVAARELPHELRRFDAAGGGSEAPAHAYQNSEEVCYRALEQIMVGSRLRRRRPEEPGGTHDVDMSLPDSDADPVRVEITELTSEMGEAWGKRPGSGRPRAVRQANGRLKYRWHASVNMTDTLFHPAWGNLVKDSKGRRKRGAEIDRILMRHLQWAESQMGTFEGAVSLANQRISGKLKPGGKLLVFPFFGAEKAPSGGRGGLTVSYDGYSVDSSTIGSSGAVEPINRVIAAKADRNQAGSLPGQRWLVVYLDPVYAIAVALSIEAFAKRRESWLAFGSEIDRRHFEEVWLVWDARQLQHDIADWGERVNVVRFTSRDSHRVVCEWPTTRRGISSDEAMGWTRS